MDSVELTLPAVAVSLILTSEGYHGVGVTVEEAEAREPECVSIPISPLIARCCSSLSHKDVTCAVTASGQNLTSQNKLADAELCRHVRKVLKSSIPCSTRPHIEQVEESMSQAGADEINAISEKLGSNLTKCSFAGNSFSA
ncbi:hypothetical protein HHK36_027641 [Tetracentron sinense]|uniref:Uncharacterized protein n=1 Tax=Tetracentron sinense TaxID=13715 RepID=A0A835D4L1_TETSI|nr:hypothetical protein HHK36_027641 [Tetracentron sinense]